MGRKRGFQRESSDDLFLSQDLPGPSSQTSVSLQRRTRNSTLTDSQDLFGFGRSSQASVSSQRRTRNSTLTESQDLPGPSQSSQASGSSQRRTRNSALTESQVTSAQNMEAEKDTQLISSVIRYLFVADRNKHPIQKAQIVKNVLGGNGKIFRSIIEKVNGQLSEVFGYDLVEFENNKFIMVNEIENHLPHLSFHDNHKQVLLYLVLVHIFMFGESCKEELIWDFLRHLGIITGDHFQHEYFGDVNQLVTVEFVNQRYLEKTMIDKNDPTQFEYTWGSRAKSELTYRSALQFVADIYGYPINKWKMQYKTVVDDEGK